MSQNSNRSQAANRSLVWVILLGAGLRLFQLGSDGFWFDEVGVAMVVQSPDPLSMTSAIRAHVAAMPLDYWTVWLFNRFCQAEACLRLPAVIWGTLTLAAAGFLFRRFTDRRTATLAVLFLAVAPLAIGYSQELRFYAALLFFYTASTALLLRAVETGRAAHWVQFGIVTIVGFYFHIYVALVFINGFLWVLFVRREKPAATSAAWIHLAAAAFVVAAAALPGYWLFRPAANYEMFSIAEAILGLWIGFGWFPNFSNFSAITLIWFVLCFLLQIAGIILAFRQKDRHVQSVAWMILLQTFLILGFNVMANYAMRGRQLLFLQPFLCLLMAYALTWAYARLPKRKSGDMRGLQPVSPVFVGLVVLLAAANMMALSGYYHSEKSRRRELAIELAAIWQPGDRVWFTPDWESKFYRYYLENLGYSEMVPALDGKEQIDLASNSDHLPRCWLTPRQIPAETQALFQDRGYARVDMLAENVPDVQLLWCRQSD